jgi:hypothetical protein
MDRKKIPTATRLKGSNEKSIARRRIKSAIGLTTAGSDYTENELEFLRAVDTYKRETGRAFPTWTEVLNVLVSLGYRKVPL